MKEANNSNKFNLRLTLFNLVTTWIAVVTFFYDEGLSSGRVGLSSNEMLRVFLASFLSVFLLSYLLPKVNTFLFGLLNIITTLMIWSLMMALLLLFQGEKLAELWGILLVVPTALFLFYFKFFSCYLIMTLPLLLYKKLS